MPCNFSNLSLAQKGMILLLVPIVVQVLLIVGFSCLHAETEMYVARAVQDEELLHARTQYWLAEYAALDWIREALDTGTGSISRAEKLNSDLVSTAKRLNDHTKEYIQRREKLAIFRDPATTGAEKQKELSVFTTTIKGMTDTSVQAIQSAAMAIRPDLHASDRRKYAQPAYHNYRSLQDLLIPLGEHSGTYSRPTSEAMKERCSWAGVLAAATAINVLVLISIGWFFSQSIVGRLRLMLENNERFIRHRVLHPRLKGGDELAQVDEAFHTMARILVDTTRTQQSIIQNTQDLVCSLDAHGRFLFLSAGSTILLGYPPQEMVHSYMMDFVIEESQARTVRELERIISEKTEGTFETRMITKDGRLVDVLCSASWSAGEKALFCVMHDISVTKAVERSQQEVLQMVSHDLRTPLSAIVNSYEMMKLGMFGQLDSEGFKCLASADHSAERMLNLINDLLEIERLNAGRLELDIAEVDVPALLEQAAQTVSPLAEDKQISLKVFPACLTVPADEHRVMQVLVNLLSNAIKFSPSEKTVTIAAFAHDGYLEISVTDEGRGVPEHLLDAVFERFRQVEASDSTQKKGTGLGLAISKALVELHGGNIGVRSKLGAGSTFWIRLPLNRHSDVPASGSRTLSIHDVSVQSL